MSTDDLYAKALYYVTHDRKASTSYLQRRLQVGYNNAAPLIERMEAEGHVSAANHVGKREILSGPSSFPIDAVIVIGIDPGAPEGDATGTFTPEPAPAAAPEPEPYTGPLKSFTCTGCDVEAEGPADALPHGWYAQPSPRLGMMHRCPDCAKKNAIKIATSTMSTEEIAGSIDTSDVITAAAQTRLKTIIERVQRLLEDMSGLRGDIKEVLDEAKGEGFDIKTIRKLITLMQQDKVKRDEETALLELYAAGIGFDL